MVIVLFGIAERVASWGCFKERFHTHNINVAYFLFADVVIGNIIIVVLTFKFLSLLCA